MNRLQIRGPARSMILVSFLILFSFAGVEPRVVSYECNTFPEDSGWERELAGTPGADRAIQDGWFIQSVGLPSGWTGHHGDADFYRIPLPGFTDVDTFFIEWRATTDNPAWLLDYSAVPVVVSAAGSGAVYHTTLTSEEVQLYRRTTIPLVFVKVAPETPHVYRVELHGAESYAWYIDGQLVEAGTPESSYPDPGAFLIWGARREYVDSTTLWDYVRFGIIPKDGSGDYDSDAVVTLFDQYFAGECISTSGSDVNAGPGCRFADFDADADVDLLDFAEFQNLFSLP